MSAGKPAIDCTLMERFVRIVSLLTSCHLSSFFVPIVAIPFHPEHLGPDTVITALIV